LGIEELVAGTVTLGTGLARGEHGLLPVPGPAVLALLAEAGAPVWAGPAPYEMCTPTGAALLAATVTRWGALPPMVVDRIGCGAGTPGGERARARRASAGVGRGAGRASAGGARARAASAGVVPATARASTVGAPARTASAGVVPATARASTVSAPARTASAGV